LAEQFLQAAPPTPHSVSVGGITQFVPLQHPSGHWVESQPVTHDPAVQIVPLPHAWQSAPCTPHVASPLVRQTPLASQQPLAQLFPSHWHAPPPETGTHSCPAGHTTQAAPCEPQSAFPVPPAQVVPLQQPVEQSVGSQYATHI